MATNLALDQDLLDRAFRVSGEPTRKATVTRALQEFIARREQRRVAESPSCLASSNGTLPMTTSPSVIVSYEPSRRYQRMVARLSS